MSTMNLEDALPIVQYNGLNTNKAVDFSGASSVALPANTTIAGTTAAGATTITSASANAFVVGRQGGTNPVFHVDASTATVLTGLKVKGAGTGAGLAVSVEETGGTNNALTIDAMGSGLLTLNGTGTGNVVIGHGLGSTPQTLTGAGAVSLTTLVTEIVSTGADAGTLADGTNGQIKIIVMKTDGGDHTLTPTTKTGFSTIVFNDAGDGCSLVFTTTTGWIVFSNNGCTIS